MMEIDAVITWVDGKDPVHRRKLQQYSSAVQREEEDVASPTRFDSLGEIFYLVASLNRFAPWLRKIFIVTDDQDPGLMPFLQRYFPGGHIPVGIVDHTVIFRGYEQYLPVFNSIAIEAMTWRIPGLSEHYIELNDDFLLAAPLSPEDFFTPDGKTVIYADKYNAAWTRLTRALKPRRKDGGKKVTFKGMMLGALDYVSSPYFLHYGHTPRALCRSFFERFYAEHPEALLRNISCRFRDASQFNHEEVQLLSRYRSGEAVLRPVHGNLFFLQPRPGKPEYVSEKMRRLEKSSCRFCCFNSLDKADEKDRATVLEWIRKTVSLQDF